MKAIRAIKQWTDAFKEVDTAIEDLQVIYEYFEAGEVSEQELDQQFAESKELVEALETKNMLRREEDRLSAVLKINAGAGGTESNDWADMYYGCIFAGQKNMVIQFGRQVLFLGRMSELKVLPSK
jgi:peptide chain release factor 2